MSSREEAPADALAVPMTEGGGAGVMALATMPEEEFEQRLEVLRKGQTRIARIKRELMVEGTHFGTIPGTKQPTLLKPGAEVLCGIYGLRAAFHPEVSHGDGESAPPVGVLVRCDLHLGDLSGPIVASGYGAANSWERKHRYRRAERSCPDCGIVGAVIKGKAEFGGGWLCWTKKGGCGAKFPADDERITGQVVEDVENPDQHDLEHTLIRMAEVRAYRGVTLRATASSDLFTAEDDGTGNPPDASRDTPKGGAARRRAPSPSDTEVDERAHRAQLLKTIAERRRRYPRAYDRALEEEAFEGPPSSNSSTEALHRLLARIDQFAVDDSEGHEPESEGVLDAEVVGDGT